LFLYFSWAKGSTSLIKKEALLFLSVNDKITGNNKKWLFISYKKHASNALMDNKGICMENKCMSQMGSYVFLHPKNNLLL
jgi:hypothetical protein